MTRQLKRNEIINNLKRKGFNKDEDGDHIFLRYQNTSGKKTPIFTKLSHGSNYREIGLNLIGKMARQCRLSVKQFIKLAECEISRDEYAQIVERSG